MSQCFRDFRHTRHHFAVNLVERGSRDGSSRADRGHQQDCAKDWEDELDHELLTAQMRLSFGWNRFCNNIIANRGTSGVLVCNDIFAAPLFPLLDRSYAVCGARYQHVFRNTAAGNTAA
jgi:hypothetical protein